MSRRLADALVAAGAVLKRGKKHRVYELPNGRTFVIGSTPSDSRADLNAISDLRKVSGVDVTPDRRKASADVREERRRRPGRAGEPNAWGLPSEASPMASALRASGYVEQQLRCRIGQLEAEQEIRDDRIAGLEATVAELEALWVVRCWRFIQRRMLTWPT